ncbi:MAG: hypothetical protein IT385_19130 [Deltaproteobacteria bacterium]|nr:hypothetical protein [Deltaproteobacteria bacterium]
MRRLARLACSALAPILLIVPILAGAACGESTEDPPGALEQAIARARPLWTPGQELPRPMAGSGPHRMIARVALRLDVGPPASGPQRLEITRTIERGPQQAYQIEDRRAWTSPSAHEGNPPQTHEDRVTGRFDGKAFAERRGDGPWIERDVMDGHAERFLARAYDLRALVLDGLGDYLRWRDVPAGPERPASVAGLPVTWREVTLDPAVRPRVMTADELRALRDHARDWPAWVAATHRPMRVDGALAFTAAGDVAMGRIEAVGVAAVDGVEAPFGMTLEVDVARLDDKASFVLPAERLPAARPRPWKMIEDVLGDDLAPIYRPR